MQEHPETTKTEFAAVFNNLDAALLDVSVLVHLSYSGLSLLPQKYKKASRACKQELLDATVVEAAA
jgi:hypothetical protein